MFPKVKPIIQEALSSELHRQPLLREIDLALRYNATPDARVTLTHILDEELRYFDCAGFIGKDAMPMDVDDALRLPQISLKRGTASRSSSRDSYKTSTTMPP